ncbi:unnamed protein product [Pylaiella littoralis]
MPTLFVDPSWMHLLFFVGGGDSLPISLGLRVPFSPCNDAPFDAGCACTRSCCGGNNTSSNTSGGGGGGAAAAAENFRQEVVKILFPDAIPPYPLPPTFRLPPPSDISFPALPRGKPPHCNKLREHFVSRVC